MTEDQITLPKGMSIADAREALQTYSDTENPTIVKSERVEALSEVRSVMEESLAERSELNKSTVEALDFEALCSEFKDDDGSLQVEAMTQTPESGEPDVDGAEALSEDADMDKAEALYEDYQTFGTERLEDDIVDALGVDDFETATEVLN